MKKETMPFLLIPPGTFIQLWTTPNYENKGMDRYLDMVLKDLKEEERGRKIEYIKSLFGKYFSSIENMKKRFRKNGLEKTAEAIEMQEPNEKSVGRITYHAKNGNGGDLGTYILGI